MSLWLIIVCIHFIVILKNLYEMKSTVIEFENPDLRIYCNVNAVLFTLLIIVLAIIAIVHAYIAGYSNTILVSLEMGAGVCLLAWGVVRLFVNSKAWYYIPTQSKMNVKSYYFDEADMPKVVRLIKEDIGCGALGLQAKSVGKIRLELFYSSDKKFAIAQIFSYEDWRYNAKTEVVNLEEKHLEIILKLMEG